MHPYLPPSPPPSPLFLSISPLCSAFLTRVQLSAARFFVNVLPLLEGVPVISARSLFEPQFPGSPLCWKVRNARREQAEMDAC